MHLPGTLLWFPVDPLIGAQHHPQLQFQGVGSQMDLKVFSEAWWKDKGHQICVFVQEPTSKIQSGPGAWSFRGLRLLFLGTQLFPWRQLCLWYHVFSCPHCLINSVLTLAPSPANSIQDTVVNNLAWHKSTAFARPLGPSHCFCLLPFSCLILPPDTLPQDRAGLYVQCVCKTSFSDYVEWLRVWLHE